MDESVTGSPAQPPLPSTDQAATAPPRRRRRLPGYVIGFLVGLAVVLAGSLIRVPYFTVAPGSLRSTVPLIEVSGTTTYPDDPGEIGYLTVTFGQTTPFGLLRGWVDDDIEVISEDEALGGRNRDENQQLNQQLMNNAKDTATAVALDALGYDVTLLGTGAVVVQVEPGTPASGALDPGDVVVGVDDVTVSTSREFTDLIGARAPGTGVRLAVIQHDAILVAPEDGSAPPTLPTTTVDVVLAARPDDPARAFLGVSTATRDATYNLPFPVTIDSGNVVGPSAGLAFTLGIIDLLTPGDLTGGTTVAVTGTITPSGDVGRVGGVEQKAAAAIGAGATVYLVPADEAAEAKARAGDTMTVIGVRTLDDALRALADLSGDRSVLDLVTASRATP